MASHSSSGAPLSDQKAVLEVEQAAQAVAQSVAVEQFAHADADALHLVAVGGADPAAGGADAVVAAQRLLDAVLVAMERQHDVRAVADDQIIEGDPGLGQGCHLLQQRLEVDHHAGTDDVGGARVKNTGGHEMELEGAAIVDHSMAGIVAAAVADHHVRLLGEQIDDPALAFVAPLPADDGDNRHNSSLGDGANVAPKQTVRV